MSCWPGSPVRLTGRELDNDLRGWAERGVCGTSSEMYPVVLLASALGIFLLWRKNPVRWRNYNPLFSGASQSEGGGRQAWMLTSRTAERPSPSPAEPGQAGLEMRKTGQGPETPLSPPLYTSQGSAWGQALAGAGWGSVSDWSRGTFQAGTSGGSSVQNSYYHPLLQARRDREGLLQPWSCSPPSSPHPAHCS